MLKEDQIKQKKLDRERKLVFLMFFIKILIKTMQFFNFKFAGLQKKKILR